MDRARLGGRGRGKGRALRGQADPRKTNLDYNKPPPSLCKFCGKNHWIKDCWKNPYADDETCKKAPAGSPAAVAYAQRQQKKAAAAAAATTAPATAGSPTEAETEAKAKIACSDGLTEEELVQALGASDASTLVFGNLARATDYKGPAAGTWAAPRLTQAPVPPVSLRQRSAYDIAVPSSASYQADSFHTVRRPMRVQILGS